MMTWKFTGPAHQRIGIPIVHQFPNGEVVQFLMMMDSSGIVELSKDIISKMLLVQICSVTTSNNMAESLTDGYSKNNSTGHDQVVSKCVCVFLSRGLPWFALQREKQQTERLCYNRLEKMGQVECKLCLGNGLQAHQFGVPVIHLPIIVQGFKPSTRTPLQPQLFLSAWQSFPKSEPWQPGCGHSIKHFEGFEGTVDCVLRQLLVCPEFKQRCICCMDVGSVCE